MRILNHFMHINTTCTYYYIVINNDPDLYWMHSSSKTLGRVQRCTPLSEIHQENAAATWIVSCRATVGVSAILAFEMLLCYYDSAIMLQNVWTYLKAQYHCANAFLSPLFLQMILAPSRPPNSPPVVEPEGWCLQGASSPISKPSGVVSHWDPGQENQPRWIWKDLLCKRVANELRVSICQHD